MATVKVLSISAFNKYSLAALLYDAAAAVFKSLPPRSMLETYDQASYDAWYDANFTDSSDGWSSGPLMYRCENEHGCMLVTPTSSRLIQVGLAEYMLPPSWKIFDCSVSFPGGSVQAAAEVILEVLLSEQRVGEGLDTYQISVTLVDEDGEIRNYPIDQVAVESGEAPQPGGAWHLQEHKISVISQERFLAQRP